MENYENLRYIFYGELTSTTISDFIWINTYVGVDVSWLKQNILYFE